jgi:hypothetical protein
MGKDLRESLIWACSPWLVRCVLGSCVAAKNKSMRPVGQSGQYLASGVGCYIWYQSPAHWLSGGADGVDGLFKGVYCNIPHFTGDELGEGFIWACSPWLVRCILRPCVTTKNKSMKFVGRSGQYLASGVRCYTPPLFRLIKLNLISHSSVQNIMTKLVL